MAILAKVELYLATKDPKSHSFATPELGYCDSLREDLIRTFLCHLQMVQNAAAAQRLCST